MQTQFYVILHKISIYFHNWELATKWNKIFHKDPRISYNVRRQRVTEK